ncbi:MAG: FlgD immunoglobulin-like domain containing protein [Candidatus Cloacimonetes bacterium]|nr:FlgD immunoglobulin-like domain containing protein [Candidatus Cloacimonadota bacterium]
MSHKGVIFFVLLLIIASTTWAANALQFGSAAPNPDYVNIGANQFNPIFNGLSGFTWEGWIRPSNVGTVSRVFHVGNSDPGVTAFAMEINANGSLTGYARSINTDGAQAALTAAATVSNGNWYYVAVTVNFAAGQKSIKVYVNGTQAAANNAPTFAKLVYNQGAAHTHIDLFGAYLPPTDPRGFQGLMDEFRYWNYAKSAAQVKSDMYKKLAGNETGLLGLWNFDETAGTTADDVSASNKNGTLVNFPANPWVSGYSNLYPVPTIQATSINTSPVSPTSQTVLWNNGNGAKRIVVMNTSNSFTDPINGDDPTADNSWNNAGQQVVFNGAGSFVTVSDLNSHTAYWYRVYEYNGSGVYTIYQTATALGNPLEGDEVLPVELSSFTAVLTVENYVTVQWVTQSETGVGGYYIYRSMNDDWTNAVQICEMINATNTAMQQVYQYTDNELAEDGTYYYWLQVQDLDGTTISHGPTSVYYSSTGEAPQVPGIVPVSGIKSIYPNPITPYSVISYTLTKAADVKFKIFNSRGQMVNSFVEGFKNDGSYNSRWDGKDSSGNNCPTGIYYIKMQAGKDSSMRKAVIIK